jgi:hypothetical protein
MKVVLFNSAALLVHGHKNVVQFMFRPAQNYESLQYSSSSICIRLMCLSVPTQFDQVYI